MPRLRPLAARLLALALAGCGSHSSDASPAELCSTSQEKADIHSIAQDWYLWKDELATVDPASCAAPGSAGSPATCDAAAYLDALTAAPRAAARDRHFSYLTTQTASTTFFEAGQNLGYGLGLVVRGHQLFLVQIFPGSAADQAGLGRGDEILAVAPAPAGLDAPASQAAAILVADAASPGALSSALGSGQVSTRAFRVLPAGAAASRDLSMTSGVYSLDPVPGATSPIVLRRGSHVVGYLPLRTFISTADDALRAAAGRLKAAGVTDLIVDLRYNGGGLIDTAEVLLDLLGGARTTSDKAFDWKFNAGHPGARTAVHFAAEPNALAPARVAFIVRGGTASASELVVNALMPYLAPPGGAQNLAIVGERTYGKPVGQLGFAQPSCDWLLFLVSFQLVNSAGTGDYFQGLPDAHFTGAACAAEDDLAHPQGDAAEASTASALQWIADGTCPAGPIAAATPAVLARRQAERAAVEASEPTLAQRYLTGLH